MIKELPEWKRFEQAVAAFAAALDPSATVKHDLHLPDRHHGGRRQRDVWIDAKISGHFPVSVLVSCKRMKRKVNSGDVDAFSGELASSLARVGVLYSYSGFTQGAIDKGRVLGISCCRLYNGKGPEIPAVLSFSSYCCLPRVNVTLAEVSPNDGVSTWADLFDLRVETDSGEVSLLDRLVAEYHLLEREAVQAISLGRRLPEPFGFELIANKSSAARLRVVLRGSWRYFCAEAEAYEVNGSYEFTKGDFKGSFATPSIDRFSSEPGPGWELLDGPPKLTGNIALMVLFGGNTRETLIERMGPNPLQPTGSIGLVSAAADAER